jgi:hypothetical protein
MSASALQLVSSKPLHVDCNLNETDGQYPGPTYPHHGVHLVLDGAQEAADTAEAGPEVVQRRQHRRQRHPLQPRPRRRLPLLLLRLLPCDTLLLLRLLLAAMLLLHRHLQATSYIGETVVVHTGRFWKGDMCAYSAAPFHSFRQLRRSRTQNRAARAQNMQQAYVGCKLMPGVGLRSSLRWMGL